MSTIPIFSLETIPAAHVSDTMLEQAAGLFSAAYGVWSAEAAERMGRRYCKQGMCIPLFLCSYLHFPFFIYLG